MTSYNYFYNFKNPIRHFIDIDSLIYPVNPANYDLKDLAWTKPFKFQVRKDDTRFRSLKIPNILAFVTAYENFKAFPDFDNPNKLDEEHKRLTVSVSTGEFKIGAFETQLREDFNRLCVYDNLLRLDIKEFYGRIYTHYLDLLGKENFLTNMNMGATNGIIMGNYVSLYFAEQHLAKISEDISSEIRANHIDSEFCYFSDDFYFFCNKKDNDTIIRIFDAVLDSYDLQRNTDKIETWDYPKYNDYNVVERFWKKVISTCNTTRQPEVKKRLVFINQLIYRVSRLADNKQRRTFINGFFRTKYFREDQDYTKYEFKDYDYHQLCYLFRLCPETLLYSMDKVCEVSNFSAQSFEKFFRIRYKESLKTSFHDEQLYLFYAMMLIGLDDILKGQSENVIQSKNQVLISYYIVNGWFSDEEISKLKTYKSEEFWFQNYHLLLHTPELVANIDQSIDDYLLPEYAKKDRQKQSFRLFYKENILAQKNFIRTVDEVCEEIHYYLDMRYSEMKAARN